MNKIIATTLLVFLTSFSVKTQSDEEKILQACINFNKLSSYFHNRKPLIILDNNKVSSNIKILFENEAVIFLSEKDIKLKNSKSYLVIDKFEIKNNKAIVTLLYKIEGIIATLSLNKKDNNWKIQNSAIYEK